MTKQLTGTSGGSSEATDIAFPLVVQAAAFMIQDGAGFLRGVATVNLAGITVATKKFVETKDAAWLMVIAGLMKTTKDAAQVTVAIAEAAGKVVESWPSG